MHIIHQKRFLIQGACHLSIVFRFSAGFSLCNHGDGSISRQNLPKRLQITDPGLKPPRWKVKVQRKKATYSYWVTKSQTCTNINLFLLKK